MIALRLIFSNLSVNSTPGYPCTKRPYCLQGLCGQTCCQS
jgi:hypothetical protein